MRENERVGPGQAAEMPGCPGLFPPCSVFGACILEAVPGTSKSI